MSFVAQVLLLLSVCAGQIAAAERSFQSQCPPSVQQVFVGGQFEPQTFSVASQLAELQSKIISLENRLDSREEAVGFTVRLLKESNTGLTLYQTIKFDEVLYNAAGGYDPNTGIFTAPLAGTYVFFVQTLNHNNEGKVFLDIVKNGTALARAHAGWSPYENGSSMGVTHLQQGDTVHVKLTYGNAFWGGQYTSFSGFRVSPQ